MIDGGGLTTAAGLLAGAGAGLVFTGAGVSAESGIRTFRGADGLWKQYDPMKTSSIEWFRRDPTIYWTISRDRWRTYGEAEPNPAHLAIAAMERIGHVAGVVTQNTDGLHARAGSVRVVELHGNGRSTVCLDCGHREPRAEVQVRLAHQMPPRCPRCDGRHVKPAVVFFGEPLPVAAIAEADRLAATCDLVLVVGSSLVVYPAAGIPRRAALRGAPVVIVNEEPTPLDDLAQVVLRGRAGEILPELLEASCRLSRL